MLMGVRYLDPGLKHLPDIDTGHGRDQHTKDEMDCVVQSRSAWCE